VNQVGRAPDFDGRRLRSGTTAAQRERAAHHGRRRGGAAGGQGRRRRVLVLLLRAGLFGARLGEVGRPRGSSRR
jgi:hypothetical protein